jgi:uncharacterized protein (DUF433 family)
MEWKDRITRDPAVLVGKPVIRGHRLSVEQILGHLASGWTEAELLENFPFLEIEDIRACLFYAQELVDAQKLQPIKA